MIIVNENLLPFLAVNKQKACAHTTGAAQSSHVRNAPINASELTETKSALPQKSLDHRPFGGGGGRGRSDDSKSRAVRTSILRLAVQMIIVKNENHLPKTRRRRRAGGFHSAFCYEDRLAETEAFKAYLHGIQPYWKFWGVRHPDWGCRIAQLSDNWMG